MTNRDPIDTVMTPWREKVFDLMDGELKVAATTGFACRDFESCNESVGGSLSSGRRGDWAYVGAQYGDALVGGRRTRVLFVSMDRPHNPKEDPIRPFEKDQHNFRLGALRRSNPHMGGVDVELESLLDPGVSAEDRCEQFALVNAVLCGPPERAGMTSVSSETMVVNCRKHTGRVMQELDPDVVIVQGNDARESVRASIVGAERVDLWTNQREKQPHRWVELVRARIGGEKQALFLLTSHPAHYPGLRWKQGQLPEELADAIARTRDEYAAQAG